MTLTCPKCDAKIDALHVAPWGGGVQRGPLCPYLCGSCASLFILDQDGPRLYTIEEASRLAGFDVMAMLQQNKVLWRAIVDGQALILAQPNRRPVLR